jgi:hypothetical protein
MLFGSDDNDLKATLQNRESDLLINDKSGRARVQEQNGFFTCANARQEPEFTTLSEFAALPDPTSPTWPGDMVWTQWGRWRGRRKRHKNAVRKAVTSLGG